MCWALILILVVLFFCIKSSKTEGYTENRPHQFYDYRQMTHLPWCDNPISNLTPCGCARRTYPGQIFPTGVYPVSCPPCKISIYETGNAVNPNTISTWKIGKDVNPVYL